MAGLSGLVSHLRVWPELHSRGGSWPYPQILDKAGEACQGASLLQTFVNYSCKKL
jgi:hypothetical protein